MYLPIRSVLAMAVVVIASVATAQTQNPAPRQTGRALQPGEVQQGQTQQVQRPQVSQGQANVQASPNDSRLAACLIVDNQNEVVLAQVAQQRAKSDDVKEFAKQMQQDHTQLLSKLRQFEGTTNVTQRGQIEPQTRAGQSANAREADRQPQVQGQQPGVVGQNHQMRSAVDMVTLKRELGAQCLQSSQKELSEKNGTEFDECYIGMQIAAHMQAIDSMKVFKSHVSSGMQQALDEGIQTAEKHLRHAKHLIRELASKEKDKSKESSGR